MSWLFHLQSHSRAERHAKQVRMTNWKKYLQTVGFDPGTSCLLARHFKLHSHQTADQPPTNADQFLWLGRVWSGKKITRSDWRAYITPINARCIRAVSLMHQRSNPALPDLPPFFRLTNPRSARPTPDLFLIQQRSIKD